MVKGKIIFLYSRQNDQHLFAGIWADDSDDEDRRPGFKSKPPKSYTAPIGFVAGGVQQAGKKGKQIKSVKEEKSDSEDEKPSTSFKQKDSSSDSESEEVLRTGMGYGCYTNVNLRQDIVYLKLYIRSE